MCPFCITTAMLIAGSVTSSGGLAAVAMKKLGVRNAGSNQRRDQDGNQHTDKRNAKAQNSVAR